MYISMAKLTLVATILGALLVAASAYKTIVTTVVVEDEGSQQKKGGVECSEQIQKQQQLSQCEQLIQQQQQSKTYIVMVGMRDVNPQQLQQCCQQLRQVEEQCRCEGIKQMVDKLKQQQQGKLQGQKLKQVIHTAENIPNMCKITPQKCHITITPGPPTLY